MIQMARLTKKVKTDVNVAVCIKEESGKYTWRRITKAVGKPRPAKAGERRDHDGVSFGASKSKEALVVDVHRYDVTPDGRIGLKKTVLQKT
jgi:hypothetical protein